MTKIKKTFASILEEIREENLQLDRSNVSEDSPAALYEEHPLIEAEDVDILQHRDAHFSGQFSVMINYYKNAGLGVNEDIDLSRIEHLAYIEREKEQNIAALFLTGADMERVAKARNTYRNLKDLYAIKKAQNLQPYYVANLILAEKDDLEAAKKVVIDEGKSIVPSLLALVNSEDFYDPLYPGYGLAPMHAVQCLGKIADPESLVSLFGYMANVEPEFEEVLLKALHSFGDVALDFLRKVLVTRPLSNDNERAAVALSAFAADEVSAKICLEQLQKEEVQSTPSLCSYLLLACEFLKEPSDRAAFKELCDCPALSSHLYDMKWLIALWEKG